MADGVTPTLAELIALRASAQGRRTPLRGRHGVSGHALSPQRGRGMEYAESREYSIGDDARHIDWRLTARSGTPHTKLFQAERERLTLVIADTAPSLYFGTRVRFKSVQAARACAMATAWPPFAAAIVIRRCRPQPDNAARCACSMRSFAGTHRCPPTTPAWP